MGPSSACRFMIINLLLLFVAAQIGTVYSAETSPDFGLCDTVEDGQLIYIDCLDGSKNFCCRTQEKTLFNGVKRWAKECCTEKDFVIDNA